MKKLTSKEVKELTSALNPLWCVRKNKQLIRTFSFDNFLKALTFVNKIGQEAEARKHHPDITISWNQVTLTLWTHSMRGLTEADFLFAQAIDALPIA